MHLVTYAFRLVSLAAAGLTLAASSPVATGVEVSSGVQIVRSAAIADKIERAAPSPGGRGGVIAEDADWRVHVAERDAPGLAELHDGDADVWYVMAGGATLVTGGTIADATVTGPGEHRGPAIKGGSELAIAAGDVITIRSGVPHWVKAVDGRLRYLVVKVHERPTPSASPR